MTHGLLSPSCPSQATRLAKLCVAVMENGRTNNAQEPMWMQALGGSPLIALISWGSANALTITVMVGGSGVVLASDRLNADLINAKPQRRALIRSPRARNSIHEGNMRTKGTPASTLIDRWPLPKRYRLRGKHAHKLSQRAARVYVLKSVVMKAHLQQQARRAFVERNQRDTNHN